jgi:hypothetical protein
MKIKGIKLDGPAMKYLVLPRQSGDIVFKFMAVLDYKEFDEKCPVPKAPMRTYPGKEPVRVTDDPEYQKELTKWAHQKGAWGFLKSISATEGLEWETVDLEDPKTWTNYIEELLSAGFADAECSRMIQAYQEVQGLDSEKIEQATNNFLASIQEPTKEK